LDKSGLRQTGAGGIFGAVNKAKKVSGIKISKALDFVGDRHGVPQGVENEPLEFKTHVGAIGPDVEQQIPWRCHSNMHGSPDFSKRPQLSGTARPPKSIPGRTANGNIARQPTV
jgi:hypothetical protein